MSDPPPRSDPQKYYGTRAPEKPSGLDPVSQPGFARIAANEDEPRETRNNPDDRNRNGHFSRWTWVMIVIAGVVLGVAFAMIAAGA
jgi:hypothetical protein